MIDLAGVSSNPVSELWRAEGPRHWLTLAWQEALRRAVDAMTGAETLGSAQFQTACRRPDDWPAPTWCRLVLDVVAGAALWAGAPQPTIEALGRMVSGGETLAEGECRDTFVEVLNQTAAGAGDAISHRLGRRVSFSPAQVVEGPYDPGQVLQIEFPWEGSSYVVGVAANVELLVAMEGPAEAASPPSVPAAPPAAAPAGGPRNLELLMEVELPLCVTFGRTQLPLKDVLKLSSGSIVELNRLANEPVEVLINNYVIARGEVVVVDGNYGIRVTEIVSRQERIRSIF